MKLLLTAVLFVMAISACNKQDKTAPKYYFDLKSFFDKEAENLNRISPLVLKKVQKNQQSEEKKIKISNWKNELELFKTSDLNKPAWKNSYTVQKQESKLIYLAKDPELRTRKVQIEFTEKGSVKNITINNEVNNSLYSSKEELIYYPDSLYRIVKEQTVRVLGDNFYRIQGQIQ
ncbi:hypothetical protein [Rubrolithibacter danxiaensis]|uniref:hypothetical protein n=1 Tax=Rubrolithibacter danxiaensis TaxID=3390805 RepID=UPI003BF80195